jgi:hypothetical protein
MTNARFGWLALLTGVACTPLKMAVPTDLATDADVIQVTDRSRMTGALANESFKMAPYEVANVDRKWNSSENKSVLVYSSSETKTGYSFTFKGPQGEAKAQCGSQSQENNTKVKGFDITRSQDAIGCACEGAAASSKIQITATDGSNYGGQVTAHGNNFTVAAVMKYENGMQAHDPVGYEFRGEKLIGAVEVANPGRIWLSKTLDDQTRADLACLAAGLLLYLPPKKDGVPAI